MANGDLLRKLLQSYKRRDDQAFTIIAQQIIADERQKSHNLLADDLEHILEGTRYDGKRVPANTSRSFDELPRDRERDSLLLEIRSTSRRLDEIILSKENRCVIEEILREFRRSDILYSHGLRPRCRLLFCGPPGCGKTLSAEIIANDLNLPLLYVRFDAVILVVSVKFCTFLHAVHPAAHLPRLSTQKSSPPFPGLSKCLPADRHRDPSRRRLLRAHRTAAPQGRS